MVRVRKKTVFTLEKTTEAYSKYLKATWGIPETPGSALEDSETNFRLASGKQIPLGDLGDYSAPSTGRQPGFLEPEQDEQRTRSVDFFAVFGRILFPRDAKRQAAIVRIVEEYPSYDSTFPVVPDSYGTPEEFLSRWQRGEVEVRLTVKPFAITISEYRMPPDDPADDDLPADDPPGLIPPTVTIGGGARPQAAGSLTQKPR
jgi:hypothetical protein